MGHAALAAWLLILGMIDLPARRLGVLPDRVVWDVTRSPDGEFAFAMPARAEAETRKRPGPAGVLEVLTYSCRLGGSHYQVQRTRAPQAVSPGGVLAELDRLKRGLIGEQTQPTRETKVVVDGVPGEDFTYPVPARPGQGAATRRTRHYIQGHSYYVLTVTSPPGGPLPADATRFLSSLTFEALVKAHRARLTVAARSVGAAAAPRGGSARPKARPKARPARAAPRPEAATTLPATRVELADSTPEGALETFLLAIAAGDAETLRAVSLADAELDRLLPERPAPPELLARIKTQLQQNPMRRLQAGDPVRMPGGEARIIKPDDVRDGRVVLWPDGAPLPSRLENVAGHWKVFARPFIAARKAATARSSTPAGRPAPAR